MTRAEWARRPGRSSSVIRKSLRFAIYLRDNFDCVYCRGVFPVQHSGQGLSLDHVVPRSRGGRSTAANLVTACQRCNSKRKARDLYSDELKRAKRALGKPIDRKAGRLLADLAKDARA